MNIKNHSANVETGVGVVLKSPFEPDAQKVMDDNEFWISDGNRMTKIVDFSPLKIVCFMSIFFPGKIPASSFGTIEVVYCSSRDFTG